MLSKLLAANRAVPPTRRKPRGRMRSVCFGLLFEALLNERRKEEESPRGVEEGRPPGRRLRRTFTGIERFNICLDLSLSVVYVVYGTLTGVLMTKSRTFQ